MVALQSYWQLCGHCKRARLQITIDSELALRQRLQNLKLWIKAISFHAYSILKKSYKKEGFNDGKKESQKLMQNYKEEEFVFIHNGAR